MNPEKLAKLQAQVRIGGKVGQHSCLHCFCLHSTHQHVYTVSVIFRQFVAHGLDIS